MSNQLRTIGGSRATLHVFSQDGAWHWGISVPREHGSGFQIVAYNQKGFADEADAESDGGVALERYCHANNVTRLNATRGTGVSIDDMRRQYMHERLRCAMARLVRCNKANAEQARKWASAWGALIGEQHFEKPLRKLTRSNDGES